MSTDLQMSRAYVSLGLKRVSISRYTLLWLIDQHVHLPYSDLVFQLNLGSTPD